MRFFVSLAGFAAIVLLSACQEASNYYLAGEPLEEAELRMQVQEHDSMSLSSGSPKATRLIHLEWKIDPQAFQRYPFLLRVDNDSLKGVVRLDTLRSPIGQLDFLWECPKARSSEATDCSLVESHQARILAVLPQIWRLQVAWAGPIR